MRNMFDHWCSERPATIPHDAQGSMAFETAAEIEMRRLAALKKRRETITKQ